MHSVTALPAESLLHIRQEIDINAPAPTVFAALLEQLGPGGESIGGAAMRFRLEAWPGGRWWRDLGNGAGHLWGHVQVIKPPTLLEICGPLAMSYAAISHVQWRVTERAGGSRLALTHRAMGEITAEHRDGMPQGWMEMLEVVKSRALA